MRWFKHVSNSHNDEKLVVILDEFGPEGYGVWWLLIETIAKEMDKSDKCSLTYPMSKWAKCLCCSKKKAAAFLKRFSEIPENSEKKLIFLNYHGEDFLGKLEISIPNLLKYRDEYSKKSGQTPDKLQEDSGAKIETQITEREEEKKDEPKKPSRPKHKMSDEEWLDSIKGNAAYQGIDVDRLKAKMEAWCLTKNLKPTRQRLLNWLNREEKPLSKSPPKQKESEYRGQQAAFNHLEKLRKEGLLNEDY